MTTPIQIYDTTMRDGTQGEGVSFSLEAKLRLARERDELGVDWIECGWPGANPKDTHFYERARELRLAHAKLVAFGSTRRAGTRAEDDANLRGLIASGAAAIQVFGKTWTLHVTEVLRTTLEENLAMIGDTIAFIKAQGRTAFFICEHFFDGYKASPYAVECVRAARQAGADMVVLADTNGGTMPWEIEAIVAAVASAVDVPLGIHAHNDCGMAVANSLAAVRAGAVQVQGTINGYGERVGNANLCSIIPNLNLKMGLDSGIRAEQLKKLTSVSRLVSELANLPHDHRQPYVGASAFAHKGGVHVSAMQRTEASYQHVAPELVGNRMRVLVSDYSGRSNLAHKLGELSLEAADAGALDAVLARIKLLEEQGFVFEDADASVALLFLRARAGHRSPIEGADYSLLAHHNGFNLIEATVKAQVNGCATHTAGSGAGPIDALSSALLRALKPQYAHIDRLRISDYKVRTLGNQAGSDTKVRVLVTLSHGGRAWTTIAVSADVIEATWTALVDGIEYALLTQADLLAPQLTRRWLHSDDADLMPCTD